MVAKPHISAELLDYLIKNEKYYVDELHKITTNTDLINTYPQGLTSKGAGWLYSAANVKGADWNIARLFGNIEQARQFIAMIPLDNLQFLIPVGQTPLPQLKQVSCIEWFESLTMPNPTSLEQSKNLLESFNLSIYNKKFLKSDEGFGIYLNSENGLKGYIRTIHQTSNYYECYIEVSPSMRSKGLGNALLNLAISETFKRGKKLIYAVETTNEASYKLAKKAKLVSFMKLCRHELK